MNFFDIVQKLCLVFSIFFITKLVFSISFTSTNGWVLIRFLKLQIKKVPHSRRDFKNEVLLCWALSLVDAVFFY